MRCLILPRGQRNVSVKNVFGALADAVDKFSVTRTFRILTLVLVCLLIYLLQQRKKLFLCKHSSLLRIHGWNSSSHYTRRSNVDQSVGLIGQHRDHCGDCQQHEFERQLKKHDQRRRRQQ